MSENNLRKEAIRLLMLAEQENVSFSELKKILQEEYKKSKKAPVCYNLKEKEFRKIAMKFIKRLEEMSYMENGEMIHIDAFFGRNNQEKSLEILTICFNYLGKVFLPYPTILSEFVRRMQLSEVYATKFFKNLLIGINKYMEITGGKINQNDNLMYSWYTIEPFIQEILKKSIEP